MTHLVLRAMRRCVLTGLILLASSACAYVKREPTNAELVEDFLDTLFVIDDLPYRSANVRRRDRLEKWRFPLRIAVLGQPTAYQRRIIEDAFRLYDAYTGYDMKYAEPGETANYIVLFVDRLPAEEVVKFLQAEVEATEARGITIENRVKYHYRSITISKNLTTSGIFVESLAGKYRFFRGDYCFGMLHLSSYPSHSLALIGRNRDRVENCIYEETYQVLGLTGDTPRFWSSLSSIRADHAIADLRPDPSPYDLLYLTALYDPRIRPGMLREEVAPVARQIIGELRPDETLPPDLSTLRTVATNRRMAGSNKTSGYVPG